MAWKTAMTCEEVATHWVDEVQDDGVLWLSLGDVPSPEKGSNSSMAGRTSLGVIQQELSSAWGMAETMMVAV